MLEGLTLWNIGGIRRADIALGPGLTVITGESGTGKSSVVRALELLGGKRGEAQMLRAGEEEGGAEARFRSAASFDGLDDPLQPDEEGLLRARRVLRTGKSRASLQGLQIPLSTYSLALGHLLHIQSQFAQMGLLEGDRQLAMVDSCLPLDVRRTAQELRRVFEQAQGRDRELRSVTGRREEIERRYANADEVLALVRRVAPEPGMEAETESELHILGERIARRERAERAIIRLSGGLSSQGLLSGVRDAFEELFELLSDEESQRPAEEALQVLEDELDAAQGLLDGKEEDLQEQERMEARLGALRRLKRLSGAADEASLLDYCRDAAANLKWLEESYPVLEALTRESLELKRQANVLAMELRRGRREAAKGLEEGVNALLGDLAMTARFEVRFKELSKLRRGGADEVEFALRSGQREGRVDKIASGGELSRLLLALQLSLPDEWLPPTLIFDEVEAGLGGRAAVLSGIKLKELSRRCQVILVTHEASIAALGDAHILIQRDENGESQVRPIEGEERVREIARMLSGSPDLEEAQEHARTLLKAKTKEMGSCA